MPIDASIYQNQRLTEAPSVLDSLSKAQSLRSIGMQQQQQQQQLDAGQIQAHLQKAQMFGQALKSVASLPPDQQPQAYAQTRNELVQNGIIKPQDAPEQHDPMFLNSMVQRYNQTASAIEDRLKQAHASLFESEAAKNKAEAAKRTPGAGDMNDPAKLVANLVPKEHQAQAFKEIDAAENTKHMAQSIMDAFDQSVKDTSGGGALTSMVKTPRSSLALHQAMQPTFKDLEGTVRQAAMDNTFKNVTPTGADSAQDIATKRAALQDYLQSKSSSPIARAYGIDLSRFPSTAKYEKPAPEVRSRALDSLIPSAQAAPPPKDRATSQDMEAIHWAQKNPGDPRSKQILAMHGYK